MHNGPGNALRDESEMKKMYRAGDEEPLLGVEAKWEREKGDGSSIERSARGTEDG